jgi:hypothetical protein
MFSIMNLSHKFLHISLECNTRVKKDGGPERNADVRCKYLVELIWGIFREES